MTKVVVNRRYGGYGLSHEAVLRICELKQMSIFFHKENGFYYYYTAPYDHLNQADRINIELNEYLFSRDDSALVQAVEELGAKANGDFSKLQVIEIPDDVKWGIVEHNGYEIIAEKHRTW